jgi:hypothetical protein
MKAGFPCGKRPRSVGTPKSIPQGLEPNVQFAAFAARDPDPEGAPVPRSCPDSTMSRDLRSSYLCPMP